MNDYEKCDDSSQRTTINLSCRRCGNTEREQNKPGLCVWCEAVVEPNLKREAKIDQRLIKMHEIHALEMFMDDYQLGRWIVSGWQIVNGIGGIMGDK